MEAFNALIERGHSLVIIEHNLDVIKCADYVIDLGPEGGNAGGELVACGTPEEVAKCERSYTGKFLNSKL
jgi:excinuclease ABC subunit A